MQRVRMAMIGGRPGRFICDAHHMAWRLDGLIDLVAGAFSRDGERNAAAGERLGVAPERVYADWRELLRAEAARPADERIELVASITPNRLHAPVITAALEHGFPVISDKPLCYGMAEADAVQRLAAATDLPTAITYTYSAYPMVQAARELIAAGELGAVRKAVAEYQQGGVAAGLASGDPERLERLRTVDTHERSAAFSDIGVHAAHLLETVTGRRIARVCADCSSVVPGRARDDDSNVLLRLDDNAKGLLLASQICAGAENPLMLRIWCERGSLVWRQHEPNTLQLHWVDRPMELLRTGRWYDRDLPAARAATRLPAGHPEGYIEAFAEFYRKMARQVLARRAGQEPDPIDRLLPDVQAGWRGMAITDAVLRSAASDSSWVAVPAHPGG